MEKYDSTFYKKLPLSVRQSIFEGATTLAAGFLAFDSTNVAGTGGGPAALLGRIGALELAKGWLLKIATDMALDVQLTVINGQDQGTETNPPENGTDSESTPENDFINAENQYNTGDSSSVQQIQIVNKDKSVADLAAKLDAIIQKL